MMREFLGAVITALIAAVIISTAAIISAQAAGVPLLNFWDPTNNLGTFNDWIIGSLDPFLTDSGLIQLGEPINIRNFGADPTGSLDSTTAINLAMASAGKTCVYAPKGTYKVTDALNLYKAGCLFGDGLTSSVFIADSASFNLAALGVIVIPTNTGGNGPTVHDIGVQFTQPDTAVRANIVAFPPGIYARDVSRQIYTSVQVGGASYCLDALGNSTLQLTTFNCGALVKGLQMDGGLDSSHLYGWHEWDFNLAIGLKTIYADGTNICMEIGRVDGIVIASTQCFRTEFHWTANSHNSTDAHFITGAIMDGGSMVVDNTPATGLLVDGIQFTSTNDRPASYQSLTVSAGEVKLVNCRAGASSLLPLSPIAVTGGNLSLNSCILASGNPGVQLAQVTAGTLGVRNSQITGATGATVPMFEQIGGAMQFADNRLGNAPSGGTGVLVAFDADNIQNYLGQNVYNSWTYTIPASTALGDYGQQLTIAPPTGNAILTLKSNDNPAQIFVKALDGTHAASTFYTGGGEQWSTGVNGSANYTVGEPGQTDLFITPGGNLTLGQPTGSHHKFNGRVSFSAATPPVPLCGVSPTLDAHATFMSGTLTCGSGAATTGTVTFDAGDKPTTWDHCTVFPHADPGAFTYSYTLSAITINGTSLTNVVFDYRCDGL